MSDSVDRLQKKYCPHFGDVIDLEDCFFCYFKRVKKEAVDDL